MDLQVPESSEGYELVELPAEPAPAATPAPGPPEASAPAPAGESAGAPAGSSPTPAAQPAPAKPPRKRRRVNRYRWDAPAWGVSVLFHVGVLSLLAFASL